MDAGNVNDLYVKWMKYDNLVNILDVPVFRVYEIKWLMELFEKKQNTLVTIDKWDDPFENFLFKQTVKLVSLDKCDNPIDKSKEKYISLEEIRKSLYGQCWTLNTEESDALWRIYSPKKKGVRVKTTLKKLFDTFYDAKTPESLQCFFLGKVEYKNEKDIKDWFENLDNINKMLSASQTKEFIYSVFVKRKEFEHENEVRLIYYNYNGIKKKKDNNVYRYNIDPNKLFDELLFDPRFEDFKENKDKFVKQYGFKNNILKSTLYQIPQLNIKWEP